MAVRCLKQIGLNYRKVMYNDFHSDGLGVISPEQTNPTFTAVFIYNELFLVFRYQCVSSGSDGDGYYIGAEEQLTGIVVEEMLDIDQQQRGVVELPDFVQEQLLGNMEEQQQLVEAEIQLAGSVTEGKLD